MGSGRKGGVSRISKSIKPSQSSSTVVRQRHVVNANSLAARRAEVDHRWKEAVSVLIRQIEQRRQENEMNIDSFDDLGLLSGMDHNDILELLDDGPWVDDNVDEKDTLEFSGQEILDALQQRKQR
ncbi:hypothetical protein ACEPAG_3592 [Sanghuangporus baumii]